MGFVRLYEPEGEFSRLLRDEQIQFVTRGYILQSNDVTYVSVAKFTMPQQSALNLPMKSRVSTT